MSESGDSGPGRREVAHRLFAAEFDDADFSYSESDEERAPNYVVTPTGARVNRLFLVGVLTELERVNDDVLRARVVDPTGPFVIYAGQYQPDELAFLEGAEPPMFVAVTGKARTFQPDDSDRVFTSVRPESISEVDADTRDRWVVQAAEQTVSRIGRMASAKQTGLTGDDLRHALVEKGIDESVAAGITLALDHYGTTGEYLDALQTTALDAARVVAGDTDEAQGLALSPGDGSDDPVPLLASVDIGADVATSEPESTAEGSITDSTTDESAAEPTADDPVTETVSDEPVADSTASEQATEAATDEPTTSSVTNESSTETGSDDMATASTAGNPAGTTAEADTTADSTTDESATDAESLLDAAESEPDASATATSVTDSDGAETDDGLGEFEPEFELDEDEREEIEQEYGTAFQSGSEVDEPGAADIETPDPEEVADAADTDAPADSGAEPATDALGDSDDEPPEPDTSAGDTPATSESETGVSADDAGDDAADIDLEDAVMEVMSELDDGSGADREELLSTVATRHGADPDAVAEAIQDALMGGRCYEPDDGKLTPI